jgi:hypothetical protein
MLEPCQRALLTRSVPPQVVSKDTEHYNATRSFFDTISRDCDLPSQRLPRAQAQEREMSTFGTTWRGPAAGHNRRGGFRGRHAPAGGGGGDRLYGHAAAANTSRAFNNISRGYVPARRGYGSDTHPNGRGGHAQYAPRGWRGRGRGAAHHKQASAQVVPNTGLAGRGGET